MAEAGDRERDVHVDERRKAGERGQHEPGQEAEPAEAGRCQRLPGGARHDVVEGRVRDAEQPHDRYGPLDEDRYERHQELRQVDEELDQADEGVQPGQAGDREERDGREPEADVARCAAMPPR